MLARCCSQVIAFGSSSQRNSRYAQEQARWMFRWAAAVFPSFFRKKGERQIGDVRWFDEYWELGDDPNATHEAMIREDQRLRSSHLFRSPLRKDIFDEIVKHRRTFRQVDEPAQFGDSKLLASETKRGAPCWVKEAADGTRTTIVSADEDDFGDAFHQIVDLRLNTKQDKVAIMLNDGRQPDAYTAVLRPVGLSVCCSGVMSSPEYESQYRGPGKYLDATYEALEAVHTLQWMEDGEHVVYSRVGALGAPTEAWLHRIGTPEALDRQLYDEEEEGYSVHVGLTRDARYITFTAASKNATEVHIMDSANADAGPVLVHERTPGLLYWLCHAHDRLIILHTEADSLEYCLSVAPALAAGSDASLRKVEGRDTWALLVTRMRTPPATSNNGSAGPAPGSVPVDTCRVIEDFVAYDSHLVLCCREGGLPTVRAAPWEAFGIQPCTPVDTSDAPEGASSSARFRRLAPKPRPLEDIPLLPLPAWAMHVVPGANLKFDSDVHVCHASSPAHPEQELRFNLDSLSLLPPTPLSAEAQEAVQGLHTRRMHVAVAEEPREAAYLEMIFSLPRRCVNGVSAQASTSTPGAPVQQQPASVGAGGRGQQEEEGGDGDDARAAEARVNAAAKAGGLQMPVTIAWKGDLDPTVPRPAVVRAYGAYGLCADVGFQADDLPLLDRGVVLVTAHIRGGGELGRAWHAAATVHRKWASLYDYASCLRAAFDHGITGPGLVALDGFSAGALPAAHMLNKAPGVLAAVLLRRPFVTILNTMSDPTLPLTVAEYAEWGDPAEKGVPELWARISPHKAVQESRLPPVFVSAGLRDTRVEWWGPVKFAWRLREKQQGRDDVWLLWDGGGHFYDDPNQIALEKTFLLEHLLGKVERTGDGERIGGPAGVADGG